MSTPVSGAKGPATPPPGLDNSNKIKEGGTRASATAQTKANFNSSVVQSTLSVAISAGNEPLALLLKSAITSINEELKAQFGDNAIENAMSQDNTAQGTAGRIVSLSTGFFEAYLKQEGLEDSVAARESFIEIIGGGFEKGYAEATEILQGLKVFEGDIASDIEKTYELVKQGYADFLAAFGKEEEADVADPA